MRICFLLDNSGSMNRVGLDGLSLLDLAKSAIEKFVSHRQKLLSFPPPVPLPTGHPKWPFPADRYLLANSTGIVAGFPSEEELAQERKSGLFARRIRAESKMMDANCIGDLGKSLRDVLDELNKDRAAKDIDYVGRGRIPWSVDPSVVIILTDESFTCILDQEGENFRADALNHEFELKDSRINGIYEYMSDSFRWDQRIFVCILQSHKSNASSQPDKKTLLQSDIKKMDSDLYVFRCLNSWYELAKSTCGEVIAINSQKGVVSAMEALASKILSSTLGCNIQVSSLSRADEVKSALLEKYSAYRLDIQGLYHTFMKFQADLPMRTWPLPEDGTVDKEIPQRLSQPILFFAKPDSSVLSALQSVWNFPCDRYELDVCSETFADFLREFKEISVGNVCSLHASASLHHSSDSPEFPTVGILRFLSAQQSNDSSSQQLHSGTLELFPLPYQFQVLYPILENLKLDSRHQYDPALVEKLRMYFSSVPYYYISPIHTALHKRFPIISYILNQLTSSGVPTLMPQEIQNSIEIFTSNTSIPNSDGPTKTSVKFIQMRGLEITKGASLVQHIRMIKQKLLKTMIPEAILERSIDSVNKIQDESRFNLPISEMGNFAKHIKLKEVMRDPMSDDEDSTRQINFGNRYKKSSKSSVKIDEPDLAMDSINQKRKTRSKRSVSPVSTSLGTQFLRKKRSRLDLESRNSLESSSSSIQNISANNQNNLSIHDLMGIESVRKEIGEFHRFLRSTERQNQRSIEKKIHQIRLICDLHQLADESRKCLRAQLSKLANLYRNKMVDAILHKHGCLEAE